MDTQVTWDLLRLALSGIAICVSVLTWYVKHFSDDLRMAEEKSSAQRIALARSPRVLAILAGVMSVIFASGLSASVAWDALTSKTLPIPLQSKGFVLLALIVITPGLAAFAIGIVALSQVGWISGVWSAIMALRASRSSRPVMLVNAKGIGKLELQGRTVDCFPISVRVLANWETSLAWVKSNQGRWRLGKDFLDTNKNALVTIVDETWKKRVAAGQVEDVIGLDQAVAESIEGALVELGAFDATIANRPLQIARAACALYAACSIKVTERGNPSGRTRY